LLIPSKFFDYQYQTKAHNNSSGEGLVFDFISIGSKSRLKYLKAQQRTFGAHSSVRHFFSITEDDDYDQECNTKLTPHDASHIYDFCHDKKRNEVLSRKHPILKRRKEFAFQKQEAMGWMCAQKRPNDGLQKALKKYTQQEYSKSTLSFPDYLVIIDDDSYVNMELVEDYLAGIYNSSDANIIAGCLIRYMDSPITIPWGGFGTVLSKGALQNLARRVDCNKSSLQQQGDEFIVNACQRLDEDLFGEKRYFQNSMNVGELIHAYVSTEKFTDYQKWTDRGFCLHSDMIWGYFFNYYNIGNHAGDPFYADEEHNRMQSYQMSKNFAGKGHSRFSAQKQFAMKGRCRTRGNQACTVDSHICHNINPDSMHRLLEEGRNKTWVNFYSKRKKYADDNHQLQRERIPVFLYPNQHMLEEGEPKRFAAYAADGLEHSTLLDKTDDYLKSRVWVVDAHGAGFEQPMHCTQFIHKARERNKLLSVDDDWRVIILYLTGEGLQDFLDCFQVMDDDVVGRSRIYRFKRSLVNGRRWNDEISFVDPGYIIHYGNWQEHSAAPVQHLSYGVRSDIVDALQAIVMEKYGFSDSDASPLSINHSTRQTDVSHFWPVTGGPVNTEKNYNSHLRDAVSLNLDRLTGTQNLTIFTGRISEVNGEGCNINQTSYPEKMLDSKIVIISQNDKWEDNYCLMEALMSGAMVMTDPMLSLPEGLEDGKSIIVYQSLQDLAEKVKYYLAEDQAPMRQRIAKEGYDIAMSRHRSWHLMERIFQKAS
jgi:hypothetical protein